jgi:hypothetical protein
LNFSLATLTDQSERALTLLPTVFTPPAPAEDATLQPTPTGSQPVTTSQPQDLQKTSEPKKKRTFEVEGTCPYAGIQRFVWKNVQPQSVKTVCGRKGNLRLWIERDLGGPKGKIYIESDMKETQSTLDKNTQIVKVGHVVGVFYSSKSGDTQIRWRAPEKDGEAGHLWGRMTHKAYGVLMSCEAHVSPTEPLPPNPSEVED